MTGWIIWTSLTVLVSVSVVYGLHLGYKRGFLRHG